jgi:hypothetical protein
MPINSIFLTPTGFISEINCGTSDPKFGGNIDVSFFKNLTGFTCESNDIESISGVTQLNNLQLLNISNNKITGFINDVFPNTGIVTYRINNNQISGNLPDLSNLINLQTFDASNNSLEGSLSNLSSNTNLTYLNLSGNKLTGYNGVSINSNLGYINLNNNLLKTGVEDLIFTHLLDAGRTSNDGECILDLGGGNAGLELSSDSFSIYTPASGFTKDGTVVTVSLPNHDYTVGEILTFSDIEGGSGFNGTYKVLDDIDENTFTYNTSISENATGGGLALIRRADNDLDSFKKYQFLSLSAEQDGRGWNININSKTKNAIKLGSDQIPYNNSSLKSSITTNSNGNRIGIGACNSLPFIDSVFIYEWNGLNWIQVGDDLNFENNIDFGSSISMSDDGNIIAIGAPRWKLGANIKGMVRVYKWNGTNWAARPDLKGQHNDGEFGFDVSLNSNGNYIAISSKNSDIADTGQVDIFNYIQSSNSWTQVGNSIILTDLIADSTEPRVSINSTGDIVLISYPKYVNNAGLIRVFAFQNGSWVKVGNDISGEIDDNAGTSISINAQGNVIAFNSAYSGYVQVYENIIGDWVEKGSKITSTNSTFGFSLSMNDEGNIIVISAPNANDVGIVEVYKFNPENTTWEKLIPDIKNHTSINGFSHNVACNSLGDIIFTCTSTVELVNAYKIPDIS